MLKIWRKVKSVVFSVKVNIPQFIDVDDNSILCPINIKIENADEFFYDQYKMFVFTTIKKKKMLYIEQKEVRSDGYNYYQTIAKAYSIISSHLNYYFNTKHHWRQFKNNEDEIVGKIFPMLENDDLKQLGLSLLKSVYKINKREALQIYKCVNNVQKYKINIL